MVDIDEFSLRKLWAEAGGSRDDEGLLITMLLLVADDIINSNISLACSQSDWLIWIFIITMYAYLTTRFIIVTMDIECSSVILLYTNMTQLNYAINILQPNL